MFRFTIRDLLWLTVVVAVLAAWCGDRWASQRAMRAQNAKLSQSYERQSMLAEYALALRDGLVARGFSVREVKGRPIIEGPSPSKRAE
jgi:hypothetical protein